MIPSFLLRPSVLASVAAHGIVGVAVVAFGVSAGKVRLEPTEASIVFASSEAEVPDASSSPVEPVSAASPVEVDDSRPLESPPEVDGPFDDAPDPSDAVPLGGGVVVEAPRVNVRVAPRRKPAVVAAPMPSPSRPPSTIAAPGDRGRVLVPPRALASNRPPAYPYDARTHGWEGVARFRVTVRVDGSVAAVVLEQSSGYFVLDEAAEAAVRSWGFTPPVVEGDVPSVTVRVPVAFRLT